METIDDLLREFDEAHMRPLYLLANVSDLLANRITIAEFDERNAALMAEADAAEKRRAERAARTAETP